MSRFIDLAGQQFGHLKVIDLNPKRSKSGCAWNCKCACGSLRVVAANALRTGKTMSCGCARRNPNVPRAVNSGDRFGRLVALRRQGAGRWRCRCDCGRVWVGVGDSLRHGRTTSCGCIQQNVELAGQRFGQLTIIRRSDQRGRRGVPLWECKCDCGKIAMVPTEKLRSGKTRSCGCLKRDHPGWFSRTQKAREDTAREVVIDGGEEWFAARKMLAYLNLPDTSHQTLGNWARACPALGGAAMRTRQLLGSFARFERYWAKESGDNVLRAMAELPLFPDVAGYAPMGEVVMKLGKSRGTVRQSMASRHLKPIRVRAKASKNGRPTRRNGRPVNRAHVPLTHRTYVPRALDKRLELGLAPSPQAAARNRGGRPRDPETEALYRFCYERRTQKATVTRLQANAHFKREAVADVRDVRRYAQRYAERNQLPF